MLSRVLDAVTGLAARRALLVGLVVTLLAGGGAIAATRLQPTTATDTLISRGSDSYQASAKFHRQFGDDAIYVLISQPLKYTVLTQDLQTIIGLEGCLSGNVPEGKEAYGGNGSPCGALAKAKPVRQVIGPGTFLNTSVSQIGDEITRRYQEFSQQSTQAAEAATKLAKSRGYSTARQKALAKEAEQLVQNEFAKTALSYAQQYGLTSVPTLADTEFVSRVVFDESKRAETPKAKFAYLFPSRDAALIQIRLDPELSQDARERAIALIRRATQMKDWKLTQGGGHYTVTGAPVVVGDLASSVTDSTKTLIIAALIVMALALAVVFRTSLRLLPLVVALATVGLTFGLLSVFGASLTMASIAVLPVLMGLVVDYAIQTQSRLQEERRAAPGAAFSVVVGRVARRGAPTIATAAAATAAGFLVLVLSPVPMVRGFGLIMVVGIAIGLLCALTLGVAALGLAERWRGGVGVAALGPALRGAGDLVFENRVARGARARGSAARAGVLSAATSRPQKILAIALAVAVVGWVLDTQTSVESDVTKLVPQGLPALQDLRSLEDATGVGGEIDIVVRAKDGISDPATIKWMSAYQAQLIKRFGYSADRGCGKAELCPAFSLPSLVSAGSLKSKSDVDALLDVVPSYFSRSVLSTDRKTATLAFGIRLMPLDRQEQVIDAMRSQLHPPKGVTAELAGLPVVAADANASVASPWRRLLLAVLGLLAVGAVLLVAFRDWRRAVVPLVPIALATGWSSLVLFATRIPLNPMSVTLGALVIAISTEFSVLLSERYRSERVRGLGVSEALAAAYRSTGAAVVASGVTAIAGFAVLVLSDIRMLRDFGAVTVVDLLVSLIGVLVVLPAVLVLAERGGVRVPELRRPRLRRRTASAA